MGAFSYLNVNMYEVGLDFLHGKDGGRRGMARVCLLGWTCPPLWWSSVAAKRVGVQLVRGMSARERLALRCCDRPVH